MILQAQVDSACPKCRSDTTHIILERYLDDIRRVQCAVCGSIHGYTIPAKLAHLTTVGPVQSGTLREYEK